jgi:hypothetical protein
MKRLHILFILLTLSLPAIAQTNPPDGGSGDGSVNDVPLDGGLTVLIAGALAYGVKKRKDFVK